MREASFGIYYDLPLLRKEVRVSGLNYGDYFIGGGPSRPPSWTVGGWGLLRFGTWWIAF